MISLSYIKEVGKRHLIQAQKMTNLNAEVLAFSSFMNSENMVEYWFYTLISGNVEEVLGFKVKVKVKKTQEGSSGEVLYKGNFVLAPTYAQDFLVRENEMFDNNLLSDIFGVSQFCEEKEEDWTEEEIRFLELQSLISKR